MIDLGGDLDSDDEAPSLVPLPPPSSSVSPLSTSSPPPTPCPVSVLTGFLGSGKSTLINWILKAPHGKRIAVIENEFGEGLSVESLIARDGVDNSSLSDFIELPNGCMCCTVKDSLVSTLENLVTAKRDDLDYILIECSGLANPGPIASVFWLDEALESRLRLDAIITLVDAKNIDLQLQQTVEAAQQIAYADRILLNKSDLVDSTELALKAIQNVNPTAPCRTTEYSKVDLDWILDAKCLDSDRIKELKQTIEALEETTDNGSDKNHDHENGHHCAACHAIKTHSHTKSISTISLAQPGSINPKLLNQWLADILWPNQDEEDGVLRPLVEAKDPGGFETLERREALSQSTQQIFRIKGIVSVFNGEEDEYYSEDYVDAVTGIDSRRFLVQAVHDLWTVRPSSSAFEVEEQRQCKLVVIGQRLDVPSLHAGFQSCFDCCTEILCS